LTVEKKLERGTGLEIYGTLLSREESSVEKVAAEWGSKVKVSSKEGALVEKKGSEKPVSTTIRGR